MLGNRYVDNYPVCLNKFKELFSLRLYHDPVSVSVNIVKYPCLLIVAGVGAGCKNIEALCCSHSCAVVRKRRELALGQRAVSPNPVQYGVIVDDCGICGNSIVVTDWLSFESSATLAYGEGLLISLCLIKARPGPALLWTDTRMAVIFFS